MLDQDGRGRERLIQGDLGEASPAIQEEGNRDPNECCGNRKEDANSRDTTKEASNSTGLSVRALSSHRPRFKFCSVHLLAG